MFEFTAIRLQKYTFFSEKAEKCSLYLRILL